MDLLSHTLSGVAVASVVCNVTSCSKKQSLPLLVGGALAAALPDVDAISLWSGFDATFGRWFNLPVSGREIYSAHYWYSHHAFFHSLLAATIFSLCFMLFISLSQLLIEKQKRIGKHEMFKYAITFFLAYNIHLLQDMLTPVGSWGGVAYLWPGSSYIGGFGYIWWWNNYDLFLIVVGILIGNALIGLLIKNRRNATVPVVILIVSSISLFAFQISRREVNYNYSGSPAYLRLEKHSVEEQKQLLGTEAVQAMQALDRAIPLGF